MKRIFTLALLSLPFFVFSQANWSTYDFASGVSITFDATVSGVNNGQFDGSGLAASPASGQLDADAWAISGFDDGDLDFGDAGSTADFTRGTSSGNVSTGGIYAFDVGSGDYTLGVQPTDLDADPIITLRVQNNSGCELKGVNFDVDLWLLNNQTGASTSNAKLILWYSEDDVTYTRIDSVETNDGAANTWTQETKTGNLYGLSVANGGYFYLRLSCEELEVSGAARDEYAIGDINLNINTGPEQVSSPSITENSFGAEISFSGGNGDGRVMFLNSSNSFTDAVDETEYDGSASSYFTDAGQQAIFAGTGASFDLSGLAQGTTYYYEVWEYYTCAANAYYNLVTENTGSFTTDVGACVSEGFDDYPTSLPEGWTSTGIGTVLNTDYSTADFGKASPSLQFNNLSDELVLPEVNYNVEGFSFWMYIEGTYNGNFGLEAYKTSFPPGWVTIKTLDEAFGGGEGYRYYIGGDDLNSYSQFKLTFVGAGSPPSKLLIDDVVVVCAEANTGSTYTCSGTGSVDFQDPSIFSPVRNSFGAEDTLIFDGGAAVTVQNFPTHALGKIVVEKGTTVDLEPIADETELYILGGNAGGLEVSSNSEIQITANNRLTTLIANDENITVDGTISFEGNILNQILPLNSASLTFAAGSNFYNSSDYFPAGESSIRPFGDFNYISGTTNFELGSNYYHNAPNLVAPFSSDGSEIVTFESGSNYRFQPGASEDPDMESKTFGNFIYNQSPTSTANLSFQGPTLDTLFLLDGSFIIASDDQVTTVINGNIELSGGDSLYFNTIDVSPIQFNGSGTQEILGTGGNISFGTGCYPEVSSGRTLNIDYGVYCKSFFYNNNGTVNLSDSLRVDGDVFNLSTFNIADDAALVQTSGSGLTNSGTFNVSRSIPDGNSPSLFYMWSNPVATSESQIGPTGELSGSPRYYFTQGEDEMSDYVAITTDINMTVGEGYAVWGQSSATFSGTVNNGDIDYTGANHITTQESYTLVGNPYPSAINAAAFIAENSSNIDAAVYLFSHLDDSTYISEKQFIAVNALGTSSFHNRFQTSASTNIASCQGFMVQAKGSLGSGGYTVSFTNDMRNGLNSAFKSNKSEFDLRDKYWIRLFKGNREASMLVAHLDQASWNYDRGLDAKMFNASLSVGIQGKEDKLGIAAFPEIKKTMILPLYVKVPSSGTYTFQQVFSPEIENSYGGFNAYILDSRENTLTPFGEDYSFYADKSGAIVDRFFIVYGRSSSPTEIKEQFLSDQVAIKTLNDGIEISVADAADIQEVAVFSIDGKLLVNQKINSSLTQLKLQKHAVYLVLFTRNDGSSFSRKLSF
ncbi:MAG: hypothetical protein ACPF8V_02865 [Luteibaculum sp.]